MDKIVIYDTETTNSTIWGSIIEVGAVVVDKNLKESTVVCPCLYHSATTKLFCQKTGYEKVIPKKCTPAMKKKWGGDVSKYVISTHAGKKGQEGDEIDIIQGWKYAHHKFGWKKYGTFDTKGRINTAYGLYSR